MAVPVLLRSHEVEWISEAVPEIEAIRRETGGSKTNRGEKGREALPQQPKRGLAGELAIAEESEDEFGEKEEDEENADRAAEGEEVPEPPVATQRFPPAK